MFFFIASQSEVRTNDKSLASVDVARKVAEIWKSMSEEQKEPWQIKGKEDKARFDLEIEKETKANGGYKLLTAGERKLAVTQVGSKLYKSTTTLADILKSRSHKKKVKDPNAPKKPLSPFFIYMKKRRME